MKTDRRTIYHKVLVSTCVYIYFLPLLPLFIGLFQQGVSFRTDEKKLTSTIKKECSMILLVTSSVFKICVEDGEYTA